MKTRILLFLGLALLAVTALVYSQGNSPGGVFDPGRSIRLSGVFTWRETLSPIILEGDTDDTFETTITYTEPTADRTFTIQNATGTVVLGEGATTGGIDAGTVSLDGSNPTSVTTGLTTLLACNVIQDRSDAPGLGPISFTTLRTGVAGRLDIYAWSATSSSNPTLIASTSQVTVAWLCTGTQ